MFTSMSAEIKKEVFKKFLTTFVYGTFIAFLGIAFAYLMLPKNVFSEFYPTILENSQQGYLDTGFNRRWDGSALGWTKNLALQFLITDLIQWWAYVLISVTILIRHPLKSNNTVYKTIIWLTSAFIFTCGFTHLMDAYTVLHPLHRIEGWIKIISTLLSFVALFFISYGLIRSVIVSREANQQFRKGLSDLVNRYKK